MKKTIKQITLFFVTIVCTSSLYATQLYTENFGTPSATTFVDVYTGYQNSSVTYSGSGADVRSSVASTGYSTASGSGNVFMNANGEYIQIAGINTSGYSNITISLGITGSIYNTDQNTTDIYFQVSADGTTWTNLTIDAIGTSWAYKTLSGSIPETSNLHLKIGVTNANQYRIDDILIEGDGAANPTVLSSTGAVSFTTVNGVLSIDTITVSGSDLSNDISLAVGGTHASMFSLSSSSASKDASTKIAVNYSPSAAGDHTAIITIVSGTASTTVSLTGKAYEIFSGSFSEDFETGSKNSYTAGDVTCTATIWNMTDAMIGTTVADKRFQTQCARIKKQGKLTMTADKTNGAQSVTIYAALYGAFLTPVKWVLEMSTNSGSSWSIVGDTVTTNNTTLQPTTFVVNQTGNVRFRVINTNNGTYDDRLNIDNIGITDYSGTNLNEQVLIKSVYSFNKSVVVNLKKDHLIEVYSLQGYKILSINGVSGMNSFTIQSGVYIVKVGSQVEKVIVQ